MRALLGLLVGLLACSQCLGLYFQLRPSERKCFLEEVPEDTLVIGKYLSKDYDGSFRTEFDTGSGAEVKPGVLVSVTDPFTGAELVKHWTKDKGSFAFTSLSGGEHKVCFVAMAPYWLGGDTKYRMEIHVQIGHKAVDYQLVARVEHLSTIEVEVRKMIDKSNEIMKERIYQKKRERIFRDTTEAVNSRVMWFSLLNVVVIVGMNLIQVFQLQSFFKKAKVL